MAKLSDSKIFYLQAFTILALVCLPGNIFTAVLLYIQHFSTTTTTTTATASSSTTTTITDNITFEGSLTLNDDETSESDISSTNLSFVDKSSNLFLLSSDLKEKGSTETDTISELEGSRKNFSSISQSQEGTTDDNSRIEKAKLKNGKFQFEFSILFVYFLKPNAIRNQLDSFLFRSDWFMKLDCKMFYYQAKTYLFDSLNKGKSLIFRSLETN